MRQRPALPACAMLATAALLQPAAADNVAAPQPYLDPAACAAQQDAQSHSLIFGMQP